MKLRISALFSLLLASLGCLVQAQTPRPIGIDDIMEFQRITHRSITDDGRYSLIVHEAWRGDGDRNARVKDYQADATALLFDAKGASIASWWPINGYDFTASSQYLVVTTHETEAARTARLLHAQNDHKDKDAKKDKDTQLDTLLIYHLPSHVEQRIDSVRNSKVSKHADWLAYQRLAKDSTLYLRQLDARGIAASYRHVTGYAFADKGASLYYTSLRAGKPDTTELYLVALPDTTPRLVISGVAHTAEGMAFSEDGSLLAFLWGSSDKALPKGTGRQLWIAGTSIQPRMLCDSTHQAFPAGFVVSPNGHLSFARDNSRLFFGSAPAPRIADTLTLNQNRPNPQIWSSDEPVQYTVQSYNLERDLKRTYTALCWLDGTDRILQVADSLYPDATLTDDRNARYALLRNTRPYSLSSMWEGRTRADYAVVDLVTGQRRTVAEADYTTYRLSPEGTYAYGYCECDSSWYSISLSTGQRHRLTTPASLQAWDDDDDHPDYPSTYGSAAWTVGDRALLLYDRYDIWSVPGDGSAAPSRLTLDGREHLMRYRLMHLDPDEAQRGLDASQIQMLRAFDERTKGYAYYSARLNRPSTPRCLHAGPVNLDVPTLARHAPTMLWAQSNFQHFPDVRLSQLNPRTLQIRQTARLTYLEDQQRPFRWGRVELVSWTSYKGIPLEGLLFKPDGFDPSQKYPLIVYYYERNSETLHDYRMPAPQRSIPDFHQFVSDGYLIFVPDIRYVAGHPGESAYDCVMSGLDSIEAMGFIDSARIGTCGHSWGGYQSAYLATRTDRFAVIESGAPVVNMFSAYGGIRWGSGLARSFQYEHTQSRLGTTMWEQPDIYAENSTLLRLDRVHTPILIMHNDQDGHVPWYQGIEMFVALKRLGRPAWLINYSGEPHWPVRMANRRDWTIRLKQFFDHYLKDAPAPRWMSEGVPAVDAQFDLKY